MRFIALAPLLLAGCAASPADLYRKPVSLTLESSKSPRDWATCAVDRFRGGASIRNEGEGHYFLLLGDQRDPWNRWDFVRTATGARAELRSNVALNSGKDAVRACA